jgi:hypothetical protein
MEENLNLPCYADFIMKPDFEQLQDLLIASDTFNFDQLLTLCKGRMAALVRECRGDI